jgi:ribonuclease-3
MENLIDFQKLEQTLRYTFKEPALLQEALRHSSYVNEQPDTEMRDNERMEFLGDAVLNLVIGHLLMQTYPHMREGDLSRIRANLVNETQLADIARKIELGNYLLLGKGELQSNGQEKNSLLANAFEAVVAAIYLDSEFNVAFKTIQWLFNELVVSASATTAGQDYKSRLQETVQSSFKEIPQYRVVDECGPDHEKTFTVAMRVGAIETKGKGKSKKAAEQEAARRGLALFDDLQA